LPGFSARRERRRDGRPAREGLARLSGPGDYDAAALNLAQHRRLSVWLWSVDTQDWMADGSGSSFWVNRIIRLAEREGGALRHPVVLMHNQPAGNPATVSALPVIIRFFRSHGYRFVRL